jgi:hypothetical protein
MRIETHQISSAVDNSGSLGLWRAQWEGHNERTLVSEVDPAPPRPPATAMTTTTATASGSASTDDHDL